MGFRKKTRIFGGISKYIFIAKAIVAAKKKEE